MQKTAGRLCTGIANKPAIPKFFKFTWLERDIGLKCLIPEGKFLFPDSNFSLPESKFSFPESKF